MIHYQPIGHAVHFHPAVQEERIDQGLLHEHINGFVLEHGLGANWNAGRDWQDVGEEGHDDTGLFVDVFGGNVREEEEPNRHPGEARILDLFDELFGDGGEDDGDNDDNGDNVNEEHALQIIFNTPAIP